MVTVKEVRNTGILLILDYHLGVLAQHSVYVREMEYRLEALGGRIVLVAT